MDNYENLPLKTRLGYQFLAQRCSNYDGQVLYEWVNYVFSYVICTFLTDCERLMMIPL